MLFFFLKKFLLKITGSLFMITLLVGLVTLMTRAALRSFIFLAPELFFFLLGSQLHLILPLGFALGTQLSVAEIMGYTDSSIFHLLPELFMIIRKTLFLIIQINCALMVMTLLFLMPIFNNKIKKISTKNTKRMLELCEERKVHEPLPALFFWYEKKEFTSNKQLTLFSVMLGFSQKIQNQLLLPGQENRDQTIILCAPKALLTSTELSCFNGVLLFFQAPLGENTFFEGHFSEIIFSLDTLFDAYAPLPAHSLNNRVALRSAPAYQLLNNTHDQELLTELHRRFVPVLWGIVMILCSFFIMLSYGIYSKRPTLFALWSSFILFLFYYADLLRISAQSFSLFLFYGPVTLFFVCLMLLCYKK